MEVVVEDDDLRLVLGNALLLVPPFPHGLDRRLHGLGARVHGQGHLHAAEIHDFLEKRPHQVHMKSPRSQGHLVRLVLERLDDPGMPMALSRLLI